MKREEKKAARRSGGGAASCFRAAKNKPPESISGQGEEPASSRMRERRGRWQCAGRSSDGT